MLLLELPLLLSQTPLTVLKVENLILLLLQLLLLHILLKEPLVVSLLLLAPKLRLKTLPRMPPSHLPEFLVMDPSHSQTKNLKISCIFLVLLT